MRGWGGSSSAGGPHRTPRTGEYCRRCPQVGGGPCRSGTYPEFTSAWTSLPFRPASAARDYRTRRGLRAGRGDGSRRLHRILPFLRAPAARTPGAVPPGGVRIDGSTFRGRAGPTGGTPRVRSRAHLSEEFGPASAPCEHDRDPWRSESSVRSELRPGSTDHGQLPYSVHRWRDRLPLVGGRYQTCSARRCARFLRKDLTAETSAILARGFRSRHLRPITRQSLADRTERTRTRLFPNPNGPTPSVGTVRAPSTAICGTGADEQGAPTLRSPRRWTKAGGCVRCGRDLPRPPGRSRCARRGRRGGGACGSCRQRWSCVRSRTRRSRAPGRTAAVSSRSPG